MATIKCVVAFVAHRGGTTIVLEGVLNPYHKVCRLLKNELQKQRFVPLKSDYSLLTRPSHGLIFILALYVDNIFLTGDDVWVSNLQNNI